MHLRGTFIISISFRGCSVDRHRHNGSCFFIVALFTLPQVR